LSMRTRRLAIVIALSFILAACQSQSLPSRSAEDKTSPASEQASATQEDAASTDRPVEPVPAEDESIAESEELTLAVIPEIATAEIEQTPLVDNTEVKVGLLLPLSGPLAREGAALLDAAQLALFDVADADFMLQP
jgi:branched-chain amino acid transport system substrate-binding protein